MLTQTLHTIKILILSFYYNILYVFSITTIHKHEHTIHILVLNLHFSGIPDTICQIL